MKMTRGDFEKLKVLILAALKENGGQEFINKYAAPDFSTDWIDGAGFPYTRQQAFSFDLFFGETLPDDFGCHLCAYLDDSHIFTALKAILPKLPDGDRLAISSNPQVAEYDNYKQKGGY